MEYPAYYHPVFVKFRIRGTNIVKILKMWLAVDGDGDYIWTDSSNNTQVWSNSLIEIINWWECSTNSDNNINSTKNY